MEQIEKEVQELNEKLKGTLPGSIAREAYLSMGERLKTEYNKLKTGL